MHVLITGAGGFVGGHLVAGLAAAGMTVTAVFRRPSPSAVSPVGVRSAVADLPDLDGLPERVDAVAHAAALLGGPDTPLSAFIDANARATAALVDYARRAGARRFIYISSTSVYGRIAAPTADENTAIIDPDAYGLTKRLGEMALAEAAADLPGLALRLPGVIGPGAHRNFLAVTLDRLRRGDPATAVNPDAPFNNAVHVADLTAFVIRLLTGDGWSGFDAMPLGAAGAVTIRGAVERLAAACGSTSPLSFTSAPRPTFTIDSRRAAGYGYRPMEIGAMLDRFAADAAALSGAQGPRTQSPAGRSKEETSCR